MKNVLEKRDYQTRVIENTLQAVADGHQHILIEAPCGAGKTVMALEIARRLHEQYNYTAGWCAMRKHLVRQAAEENDAKIGFKHIEFFSMFNKNPPSADVLIDDEGHHTAAESAVTIYQKVNPRIHIALTATPFRTDRMKLCFSKVVKDSGIRALIDQGYLAPYHHYTFDNPWTPENVASAYLNDVERWGKTVGYFLTRVECEACAQLIRRGGVPCEVVWAGSDQEAQIAAFSRGEVPILLNMFILTEGFNAPDLKTVMVRPGSKGPTIQMTGRVLRPKPYAQVIQNNDTKWLFSRTASPEQKFVLNHNEWEDRDTENTAIVSASHNTIMAIPRISVDIPAFIGKHRKKARVFGRE
jgi:superfamily II DNA or RNA helicase